MAKIKYASFVTGLSGRSGSNVFYRSSSSAFGYMRNHVQPVYTDTNEQRGKEFQNLGVQYRKINTGGKEDLRSYARKYSNLPANSGDISVRANNGMAVFVAMCWRIKKTSQEGAVALNSLDLSDITTLYNVASVVDAVDAGYLPAVPGYEEYAQPFD